jgi:hypothetical protein
VLALAEAIAVNQGQSSHVMFRFHRVAQKIAKRFSPEVATAWTQALTRFKGGIDESLLRSALAAKSVSQIEAAVSATRFGQMMKGLEDPLTRTAQATGQASASVLKANGLAMQFNAVDPNVVLFARDQSAQLVVDITDDTREAIRTVVALGAQEGLTVPSQARAIREVIGLPPNQLQTPFNFERELRSLDSAATRRRLSAVDKAQIRSRIKSGNMPESFISKMRAKYTKSLVNRRSLNIARTETIRSANFGQQQSWVQGMQQGVIPKNSRRFWIVTPDERLSPAHSRIPGMNPQGRGMVEPFFTPDGVVMYPPSRPNCRCGIGPGVAPTPVPQPIIPGPGIAKKAVKKVAKKKAVRRVKKKAVKKKAVKKKAVKKLEAPETAPSGMHHGTVDQANEFVRESKITEPLYHGTRRPDVVRRQGIRASTDEARDVPGVSLTRSRQYAAEYAEDGGEILEFRARIVKPIQQSELERLSGAFDVSEMDAWAKRHGYDAIIGPNEVRVFDPKKLFLVEETDAAIIGRSSAAYPELQAGNETIERFLAKGKWSPERQRLHDAIVRQHLEGVTAVEEPRVMVMGGGTASGKSSMLRKLPEIKNHVKVDPDHIKSLLPEFQFLPS